MISTFQKNKKSITTVMLAGIATILMVSFGLDARAGLRRASSTSAITIDGESISVTEFQNRYEQILNSYRQQYGANFSALKKLFNLEQRTIENMLDELLLNRFSSELGLTVGPQQIENRLQQMPYFQQAGLTQASYERFVQASGLSMAAFEDALRKDLVADQLREMVSDLSQPSEQELKTAFEVGNTKAEFEYLPFTSASFAAKVVATDEAKLKEFFDAGSEMYRKPKSVRYSYVAFPPSDFAAKVSASEDDLKDLYARKEREFTDPKQVHLRQIVVNRPKAEKGELEKMLDAGKDSSPAAGDVSALDKKKRQDFEALRVRLDQGENFIESAKTNSEDKATSGNGGDLGWQPLTALPKEFKSAVDQLDKGRVSEVLATPEKYVIFLLEEVKDPQVRPFESVRAQLETEFKNSIAPEYARVEAENFNSSFREASAGGKMSLDEFAKSKGKVALVTQGLLASTDDPTDIKGLTTKVLSTPAGESDVVRASEIDYVVHVMEAKDSYIPEMDLVKEKVVADFKAKEANRLAREASDAALLKLKAADPKADLHQVFETIAKENGIQPKATAPISKNGPNTEDLFVNPETKKVAFGLTPEHPLAQRIASGNDAYFVYRLVKKTLPTEEEMKNGLKTYRATERAKVENRMFAFLLETLKSSSNIWINPEIVKNSVTDDV